MPRSTPSQNWWASDGTLVNSVDLPDPHSVVSASLKQSRHLMLKRKSEVVALSVQLQLIPSPHACAVLAQELVKHYLYMRNQLPGLFDTLQSQLEVQLKQNTGSNPCASPCCSLTTAACHRKYSSRLQTARQMPSQIHTKQLMWSSLTRCSTCSWAARTDP